MIQLYYKKISNGGKVSYHPLTPDAEGAESIEITNRQAITVAVALIYPIVMNLLSQMPEHKRSVREIRKMLNDMLKLLKGTGEEIDDELAEHMFASWNLAMAIGQMTGYETGLDSPS